MASARGQVPLGMLPPGHRVTIEHPAFPEPSEGEFVQIYQTSSGAGKTVLLFFMDKETGLAVQEKYRCMVLSNSITEEDMGRVLVLHEDELDDVKVTPRPVVRCGGCQHGHGVDDLIARHGLLPFDLMSREMRRLEERLRSKQVPGARRWAQQAVVAMQGDEDEAVRWVQIEFKKQGPWPAQVSCGVKECKAVLECMELAFWLDEEVRKSLSTEEAMRDQAAAGQGQEQEEEREEEAADMVPPYRPPMSPTNRLRGMKRPLTGGPDAQREAREAASTELRREEEEEAATGSSQQGRSWMVQVSSSSTGTSPTSSPGSARGGGRRVEVQQAGGKSPSSMVGPAKASKRPRPSQQGPHGGGGGGGGGRQTDMKQFVFRKTFSPTALAEEEARDDVVSALVGMGFDPAQARRAARGGATLHAALEKLEEMQKEEEQQQGGRGDESKMRVFDYDSGDDQPRVVPERGVLRSCQSIKVFWQGESETRSAIVDVVRDSLPTWEAFQSMCAKKLGLDTSRLFIDCLEVLRSTALGIRRTEIRSIKDLQRELGPGMHVEVKTVALDPTPVLIDNMGPEEPIASLLNQLVHSPAMQRQIWDLKPRYPRWRRVRGDGNCYYRAVMFGLCLQCLVDPQRMKKLKALVRRITSLPRDMADKLLKWLEDDAGRLPLEQDFTNTGTGVDEGLVLLARYALSDFIRKQRHASFSGGLSMQQMAEAEGLTLEDYCRQHIETMGVDAEGFQLDLGLLPYILELTCHTWVVQRNTLELVCITRPSGPPRSLEISLLLVPGHYSFLVPRQPGEPEEEQQQQQHEQPPYFGIPSPISPDTCHQARDDSCLTPPLPSSPTREDMSGIEEKSELAVESGRVEPGSQEEEAKREGRSSDDRGHEDGNLDHATDLSYPAQQGESSTSAVPTRPAELAEDGGVRHEETQQQDRDSLCIDGSAPVVIDGVANWLNRVKGVVQDLIVKKLG